MQGENKYRTDVYPYNLLARCGIVYGGSNTPPWDCLATVEYLLHSIDGGKYAHLMHRLYREGCTANHVADELKVSGTYISKIDLKACRLLRDIIARKNLLRGVDYRLSIAVQSDKPASQPEQDGELAGIIDSEWSLARNTKMSDMHLTTRAISAYESINIKTVEDFIKADAEDLFVDKSTGIKPTYLRMTRIAVRTLGIRIISREPSGAVPNANLIAQLRCSSIVNENVIDLNQLGLSERTINTLHRARIYTVGDVRRIGISGLRRMRQNSIPFIREIEAALSTIDVKIPLYPIK